MSDYSAKLKDPRWQKKRLEVFNAHDFTCQMCGAKDETLHVHHVNYHKGAKPWEYELHELRCFCERCHKEVEGNIESARVICADIDPKDLHVILWHVRNAYFESVSIGLKHLVPETFSRALARITAATAVASVKLRMDKCGKFDEVDFENALTDFLIGGEVEK